MATRKKAPPSPAQPSFSFPSLIITPEMAPVVTAPTLETVATMSDEEIFVAERKLRLVPPLDRGPEEDVIVEPDGNRFAVSIVRHHGSTVATVLYTRRQLEMLQARIPAALEVG